jgi:hypothetical protein
MESRERMENRESVCYESCEARERREKAILLYGGVHAWFLFRSRGLEFPIMEIITASCCLVVRIVMWSKLTVHGRSVHGIYKDE